MDDQTRRVAEVVAKARGCNEEGSALSRGEIPCPFCHWTEEAEEESGCVFWAEKIMEVIKGGA